VIAGRDIGGVLGVFFSFAFAGAIAQFIDGTLGMGFGVTSSTVLIFLGATPVAASSSVYFATIGTSLSSGIAHWREGNVDKVILLRLALPGAIGAFLGATVLTRISTDSARGYMSTLHVPSLFRVSSLCCLLQCVLIVSVIIHIIISFSGKF